MASSEEKYAFLDLLQTQWRRSLQVGKQQLPASVQPKNGNSGLWQSFASMCVGSERISGLFSVM